jgi:hypothetical protein
MRYACLRNVKRLQDVVEATGKSHPRPDAPKFDAAITAARQSASGQAEAIRQAELDHPEEVSRLRAWTEELERFLAEPEEVEVYQLPVGEVGDLVDSAVGTVQRGLDAGRLTLALLPMIVE